MAREKLPFSRRSIPATQVHNIQIIKIIQQFQHVFFVGYQLRSFEVYINFIRIKIKTLTILHVGKIKSKLPNPMPNWTLPHNLNFQKHVVIYLSAKWKTGCLPLTCSKSSKKNVVGLWAFLEFLIMTITHEGLQVYSRILKS